MLFLDFSDLVEGIFCPGMCCSAPPRKRFVSPLCTTLYFFVSSLFITLCHFVLSFHVYSFPTFPSLVWSSQLLSQLLLLKLYCFQIHYHNLHCSCIGAKFDKTTIKFFNAPLLLSFEAYFVIFCPLIASKLVLATTDKSSWKDVKAPCVPGGRMLRGTNKRVLPTWGNTTKRKRAGSEQIQSSS